jgi:hypothetical protein
MEPAPSLNRKALQGGGRRSLPSRELHELWFASRRRDWKSLVVVPASPGRSALPIAQALGEVGGLIRMRPVQVVSAQGMDLPGIATLVMDMTLPPGTDRAIIVAIEAVVDNPLVLPVALSADAVLLCVQLGATEITAARHTIELIGRDRVIGCVLISDSEPRGR